VPSGIRRVTTLAIITTSKTEYGGGGNGGGSLLNRVDGRVPYIFLNYIK
jgi:hypothetical protein